MKLYIYGYLNPVQSSHRLEREAGRNVEVMWLLGRLAPDHKTIDAIIYLTEADQVTGEVLHVDGGAHVGKW